MSFAPPNQQTPVPVPGQPVPPSSFPLPSNPTGPGSRSTTIPGSTALDGTPPTTAQFLGSLGNDPQGSQVPPMSPFAPAPGQQYAPMPSPAGRRRGGSLLIALLILGPVVGISVSVWAFLRGREASNQAEQIMDDAQETVDSILSGVQDDIDDALDDVPPVSVPASIPVIVPPTGPVDTAVEVPPVSLPTDTVPPVSVPEMTLFDPAGATAVMGTFDAAISGEPTRLLTATIYPQYAFVQAQDANIPTHVDEYEYRDGIVGAPAPVTLMGDGDLEANLFSITDVDWSFINRAVTEAPGLMPTVEEGAVTHIIVERSVFRPDFSVTVRVYVSGPRGGGYVEYTTTGELIQVVV